MVRFTLLPHGSLEIENDFLFNICFENLENKRTGVVLSYLLERGVDDILTKTDSFLINPDAPSKTLTAQFEQSDLIFPPTYEETILLGPLRFDKTECLRRLEFDLLLDTNELQIAENFPAAGFRASPLVKHPIEGGYRIKWNPWDYTESISNEFLIPLKKENDTPGKFEVIAKNFKIENFEGDSYSVNADNAILYFEDTTTYDFVKLSSIYSVTEEFERNTFSVLAESFEEISEFQLDFFLPGELELEELSMKLDESLLEGDVSYDLVKLNELDYIPHISNYRLNWSRSDTSVSFAGKDTLVFLQWINETEIPFEDFGKIKIDSRYFADKNLDPIPSTVKSTFEYDECIFVDPVIQIYASPTGSDTGIETEIPVYISLGRNHNITDLSFDICFEPFMVSSIDFRPQAVVEDAIISTSSYIDNEAIPCINFVWQSEENDISGDEVDILLGHAIVELKDNAPYIGRVAIDPYYVISSNERCEALVQLESTCPLFSEKIFIYPHNDVMTFQFDSIYGRAGEIKTINLSVNQLHNLESFDIRLNVDTQLVNLQSISIPELSHPWDEALISSRPDLNDPIIRGVNLPYLDSLDIGASFDLAVLELLVKQDISGCTPIINILSEESRFKTHTYPYSFRENETSRIHINEAHLCYDAVSNREINNAIISLYPNPATNQVTLTYPDDLQVEKIYLRDLSGRIVQEWDGRQDNIDVRGLQGLYFIEMVSKNSLFVEKLVVLQD